MEALLNEIKTRCAALADEPRRLFHGRGQTVPGFEHLVIDWYPPVVLVTLYRPVEQPILEDLKQHLEEQVGQKLAGIVVQDRSQRDEEPKILDGSCPSELAIREAGLNYLVRPLASQNIGFFPDMKPGRQLIRQIAREKKVLNLFAYTCSFSVAAIAGGAAHVTNLDINENLLARGRENHRLNDHDLRRVAFMPHNLFKSFGRLKKNKPYDLVVIDPPYQQGRNFRANRDWPKIMRHLPELVTPGGEIVAAVSAPELGRTFLRQQFSEYLPQADLVAELTGGDSFPEADPDKGLHIQHYRL
mgnify:CR=1 FL=1